MNALVFRFRGADSISGRRTNKIPAPSGRGRREGRRVRAVGVVNRALHKKSWAVILWGCALSRLRFADRPYNLGFAIVGALYERPRSVFCAKPVNGRSAIKSRTKAQAPCHILETTTAFISLCKPKQVD